MSIERKYLAHFIDANFGSGSVSNYRLGKDIEEFNEELNGEVEKKKNILGETSVLHKGYEPSAGVGTFYPDYDEVLSTKLFEIANDRLCGDNVRTTMIDVLLKPDGTVISAHREDVVIDVKSIGGGIEAVNTPFDIHYAGNRVSGTFDMATKTFTPSSGTIGLLRIEVKAGASSTKTQVTDVIGEGSGTLKYKVANSLTKPNYGDADTGYTALTLDTDITVASTNKIIVVESTASGIVAASTIVPVVVGT